MRGPNHANSSGRPNLIGKANRAPMRKIVGRFLGFDDVPMERLECGHGVPVRADMLGATDAIKRRCRLCREARERVIVGLLAERFDGVRFERVEGFAYLFAKVKGSGYFAVTESNGKSLGTLDRAAFRGIAAEAKFCGIEPPFHVYARICTYSGPNLCVYQPGAT
jgi:hypothetical protein